MDFEELWGWLTVLDAIEDDPLAFEGRLWGTEIVDVAGADRLMARWPAPRPTRAASEAA